MLKIKSAKNIVSDNDLLYVFNLCTDSVFVQSNSSYRKSASNTVFMADLEDDTVNAYAGQVDDDGSGRYKVLILGGLINWIGHFAFIKTLYDVGMPVPKVLHLVEWTRKTYLSKDYRADDITSMMTRKVKYDFAKYKITSTGFTERWRSNLLDCVYACTAHELGHVCLGHCDGTVYDETVMSSNRNIERQADLFSFSILQSGTSVAIKALGAMWLQLGFYCLHPEYEGDLTHPNSFERVENAIQSFRGLVSQKDVDLAYAMLATMSKVKKPRKKDK